MPVYLYQCYDCGLQEEVLRSMSQMDAPHACTGCGKDTKRQPTAPYVQVGGTPDFSKNDRRDFDRLVGANAEQRWDHIKKEQVKKNEVRKASGQVEIGRTSDGQYAPVPKPRLEQRQKALAKAYVAEKTGIKVTHE